MATETARIADDGYDFRVRGSLRGRVDVLRIDPDRVVVEEPRDGYVYEDRSRRPRRLDPPPTPARSTEMRGIQAVGIVLAVIGFLALLSHWSVTFIWVPPSAPVAWVEHPVAPIVSCAPDCSATYEPERAYYLSDH